MRWICQISGLAGVASPRRGIDEATRLNCPHCPSSATTKRNNRSALGYARFNCRTGKRRFNDLQYPTDNVLLAVPWQLRYKLGFGDVAELLLERGFEATHDTIRAWEFRFAPLLAEQLRGTRRGNAGVSWYLDETYVKVPGSWCYLYRAIDRDETLLDLMLSKHRDNHSARRFLHRLVEAAGRKPRRVTTDHHPADRKAIRRILGRKFLHRRNRYLNNFTEQDHRGVKQRHYSMLGDSCQPRDSARPSTSCGSTSACRAKAVGTSRSPNSDGSSSRAGAG